MATETIYSTATSAPSNYQGTIACQSHASGNPGTASCQAPVSGNCTGSPPLGSASADFYGFPASTVPAAWRTSLTLNVQFTHITSSCAQCNVAAFDTFYSVGGGWTRIAQDSLCTTSSSQVLSLSVSTTIDLTALRIAVIQYLSAKVGCSSDCSQAATSVERVWVDVNWTEPTGACCTGTSCSVTTEALCTAGGGTYQGNSTTCTPDPCDPTPTGACCEGGVCSIKTEAACTGTYLGDDSLCSPDPCSGATGACCQGSVCFETTEAICDYLNGSYKGDGVLCSSSPCPQTPPAGGLLVG